GSITVLLAVRLVVLFCVGDEVGECEAVVGDDEVDALGGRGGGAEHVARPGEPGRKLAAHPSVSPPEPARGVAKTVVPFGEGRPKRAKPIAARTDVPRLGDQPRFAD